MNIEKKVRMEAELYELDMLPGVLIGKAVIDKDARIVGIVRNLKVTIPDFRIELIVKGVDIEIPIDIEKVSNVGNVVQLNTSMDSMESVDIEDIVKLTKELKEELIEKFKAIERF